MVLTKESINSITMVAERDKLLTQASVDAFTGSWFQYGDSFSQVHIIVLFFVLFQSATFIQKRLPNMKRTMTYCRNRCNLNYSRKAVKYVSRSVIINKNVIDSVLALSRKRAKGQVVDLALMYLLPDELLLQCTALYLDVNTNVRGLQLANKRMRRLALSESVWFIHTSKLLRLPAGAEKWSGLSLCKDSRDPKKPNFGLLNRQTATNEDMCNWREIYYVLMSSRKLTLGEQMDFRGFYTDGGCDGSTPLQKQRYWVGNMFKQGTASHYCSEKEGDINTWSVLSRSKKILRTHSDEFEYDLSSTEEDEYLVNERRRIWRRFAILSCFKGSKIPSTILPIIETYELESLLISAIQDFADDLVNKKFRAQLRKHAKFKFNDILKQKKYRKELAEYRKELPQKRARYRESLERFREKILYERREMEQQMQVRIERSEQMPQNMNSQVNPVFDSVFTLDGEEMKQLLDYKMLRSQTYTHSLGKLGISYGCIDSINVSRVGNFTCPIAVGAVLTCVDDAEVCIPTGYDEKPNKIDLLSYSEKFARISKQRVSNALSMAKDYKTLLSLVAQGDLPPIARKVTYNSGTLVVEFEVNRSTRQQPLIWFTYSPKTKADLSIRTRLALVEKRNTFTHKLLKPRLARYMWVKLISAKEALTGPQLQPQPNIDCSSVVAYGHILQVRSLAGHKIPAAGSGKAFMEEEESLEESSIC